MKTHDYELVKNRLQMNVKVFGCEKKVNPLYISEKSNAQALNVLLITNEGKSCYVFIKDFEILMYSKAKTKDSVKNTSVWLVYKIFPANIRLDEDVFKTS